MPQMDAGEFERDSTMKQFAMKAKIKKENEGGYYWLVAAGDVVLFASTQVPEAETETWNPPFQRVMSSLLVTRDQELFYRKLSDEVLERLRKKDPDEEFELDEKGIRGKHQLVYLSNLHREIKELVTEHVVVPASSGYAGRPLGETRMRTRTGASAVALVRDRHVIASPGPEQVLEAGDVVVVIGTMDGTRAAASLFEQ